MTFQEEKGVFLSEKAPANVSSIWKVFANLLGTCQVQLYSALFRARGMHITLQEVEMAGVRSSLHRPKSL